MICIMKKGLTLIKVGKVNKFIVGIDPSMNGTGVVILETDETYKKITDTKYLGFTQVKKMESQNIIFSRQKDFSFRENKMIRDVKAIIDFIDSNVEKEDTYIALEDYAYGATGNTFNIGEFVGLLKIKLIESGYKLRLYEPSVIKKFATGKGNADKVSMGDAYINSTSSHKLNIKENLEDYESPKADIVDAFWIASLNLLERQVRIGTELLSNLTEKQIEIFNAVSNKKKINILTQEYLTKE